jgi:hypothetical protein
VQYSYDIYQGCFSELPNANWKRPSQKKRNLLADRLRSKQKISSLYGHGCTRVFIRMSLVASLGDVAAPNLGDAMASTTALG